jgi:hypothetical protein
MRWMVARRELLRKLGLGAACLPLLRASEARAGAPSSRKLICVAGIHGYRQVSWKPQPGPLAGQTLPPSLTPLEPHRADLLFATGLVSRGASGDAAYGTMFWGRPDLVGTAPYLEPNGKTLDQVVGAALAIEASRRPSVNLGVQVDLLPLAATQPAARRCFWSGRGQPITPLQDPLLVYQDLFAGGPSTTDVAAAARLVFQRKSVLDYVGGSLERFAKRVGTEDRTAIQRHLQSLRELEAQLEQNLPLGCTPSAPPAMKLDDPAAYPGILDLHFKLITAALACGVTRVATLQLADAVGTNIQFPAAVAGAALPGAALSRSWKEASHNPILNGIDWKQRLDQWWMGRCADLIAGLKAAPDANGTSVFDNTVIVWANPVEEGAAHDSTRMPWLLAGSCGGAFRTGQSAATAGTDSVGVLAAVCTAMGVPGPFGTPTPGLLS